MVRKDFLFSSFKNRSTVERSNIFLHSAIVCPCTLVSAVTCRTCFIHAYLAPPFSSYWLLSLSSYMTIFTLWSVFLSFKGYIYRLLSDFYDAYTICFVQWNILLDPVCALVWMQIKYGNNQQTFMMNHVHSRPLQYHTKLLTIIYNFRCALTTTAKINK